MAGIRLQYTAAEIDTNLSRAESGGALDQEIATKQDELTFDATPQANSTNPVESGGIADADDMLESMVLAAFQTGSASGSVAAFTDGADGVALKSATFSIEPKQDLNGQSYPWPAGGGKNKLQVTASSQTKNGVAFSVASDGKITTSNSATSSNSLDIGTVDLVGGTTYAINGCASGGGQGKFGLGIHDSGGNWIDTDFGSGITYTPSADETITVAIRYWYGITISGTWKPMVRLASVTDATFAPYSNICPINILNNVNGHNPATNTVGYYYDQNLEWTASATTTITDYIPCDASTRVSILLQSVQPNVNLRVNCFNAAKKIQSQVVVTTVAGTIQYDVTIPQGTQYIRVSTNWNSAPIWHILVSYSLWRNATIYRTNGVDLLAGKAWTTGSYYNDSGAVVASANLKRMGSYIPVVGGQPYIFSCKNNDNGLAGYRIRIHEYDSNQTWLRQIYSDYGEIAVWTASDDAAYIRMSLGNAATDIVCYLGNIYPILFGASANLYDYSQASIIENKVIGNDGAITDNTSYKYDATYYSCVAGGLLVSGTKTVAGQGFSVAFYDSGKSFISRVLTVTGADPVGDFCVQIEAPSGAAFFRITGGKTGFDFAEVIVKAGEIVCGGTLAYLGGGAWRLTRTHSVSNFANGSWVYKNEAGINVPFFECDVTVVDGEKRLSSLSNKYLYELPSTTNTTDCAFGFLAAGNRIRVRDSRYTTVADFVASLADTQFYYPLATPTTYDLTTEQVITTLKGSNAIRNDAGDSAVEYAIDPTMAKPSYPLVTAATWNTCMRDGSVTPAITLPAIGTPTSTQEFQYVFTAASTNASFTAPAGVMLTDGTTTTAAGGTLSYSDLTANSVYECNFAVITTTLIALVMKKW